MYMVIHLWACACVRAWLHACVCVTVRVRVRACPCVCVRVWLRACVWVPVYPTYRELPQVATLVGLSVGVVAAGPEPLVQPGEKVPHRLGAGDDVEGGGQRAPLIKVAHPQLGAGELPLNVGVVLHPQGEHVRT